MPKKKKQTNGNGKKLPLNPKDYDAVVKKRLEGELLMPSDLDMVLRKAAEDMREKVSEDKNMSPITYVAESLGVDKSSINSYFFTSYGVFQKDLKEKLNPYVAFTVSLIHALNLGYLLGSIEKGGKSGPKRTKRTAGKAKKSKK